jgi:antitoxin ParD1/3/4
MPKHTSVVLGTPFEAFVAAQVAAGRYRSATEVIRAGLRLLKEREGRLQALREAMIAGETSGAASPLDLAKIKSQARKGARRQARGCHRQRRTPSLARRRLQGSAQSSPRLGRASDARHAPIRSHNSGRADTGNRARRRRAIWSRTAR